MSTKPIIPENLKKYIDLNNFDASIQNIIKKKFNWQHFISNTKLCLILCDLICEYQNSNNISRETFDVFIEYVINELPSFSFKSIDVLVSTLCMLFKCFAVSLNHLRFLLRYSHFDVCYKNINVVNFNDIIKLAINTRLKYGCFVGYNDNDILIDIIFDKCIIDGDIIMNLCKCRSFEVAEKLADIIDNSGVIIDDKLKSICMIKACKSLPYTKKVIVSLEKKGIEINSQHLAIICKYCNNESIEYILQQTRLPIDHNHFIAVLCGMQFSKENYNKNQQYYRFSKCYLHWVPHYEKTKMDSLIKYGFVLTYDDVMCAAKLSIEIPDIDRFGIVCDKKMLELCESYKFYPNYKFIDLAPEMFELRMMCTKGTKANIGKFIKKHKLVPDSKCMENAASFKNNMVKYKLLECYGGVTTLNCVINCAWELKNNNFLMYLVKSFENVYNAEINALKNEVSELKKQLNEKNNEEK